MAPKKQSVIVAGGGGYIGRCMIEVLLQNGFEPISFDNFSTSRRFTDPRFQILEGDLTNYKQTRERWKSLPEIRGIFHFAARALVPESHEKPAEYFHNNLLSTITLADIAVEKDIPFVHSSSCAVYGVPATIPIEETSSFAPISPYGETKCAAEHILSNLCQTRGLKALNLRYFNPAGAMEGASHGENHEPETHLIPNLVKSALDGRPISVFGTDYPTKDGSCVRDFIHIQVLVEGHIQAFEYLRKQKSGFCDAVNLGSGSGFSVLETIAAAEEVLKKKIRLEKKPRRAGDPPVLIAATQKAQTLWGYQPTRSLSQILKSEATWAALKNK